MSTVELLNDFSFEQLSNIFKNPDVQDDIDTANINATNQRESKLKEFRSNFDQDKLEDKHSKTRFGEMADLVLTGINPKRGANLQIGRFILKLIKNKNLKDTMAETLANSDGIELIAAILSKFTGDETDEYLKLLMLGKQTGDVVMSEKGE